jgi:hypothetical protein
MILQVSIAVLGGLAIYLTQQKRDRLKRYACLFGLASQPLFAWTTYEHGQWGMFTLCLLYTWCWGLGLFNYWILRSNRSIDKPGDNTSESATSN